MSEEDIALFKMFDEWANEFARLMDEWIKSANGYTGPMWYDQDIGKYGEGDRP